MIHRNWIRNVLTVILFEFCKQLFDVLLQNPFKIRLDKSAWQRELLSVDEETCQAGKVSVLALVAGCNFAMNPIMVGGRSTRSNFAIDAASKPG